MPRRAKIALVAVVLVLGFLGALQFRRAPAEKATAEKLAGTDTAQKPAVALPSSPLPLDLPAAPPESAPPVAPRPAPVEPEKPAEVAQDHTAASAKPSQSAVPELPAQFSGVDRPNRATPFDLQTDSPSEATTSTTHKVVDGDSLPRLAERYLGSANRASEIFACNRDVLSDPELLPIGVRLRIPTGPPRPLTASNVPAGSTNDAATPSAAPETAAQPTPAVPSVGPAAIQTAAVPEKTTPLMNIGAAGLLPLPPIGEQTHPRSRIYIVQTGDTLSSIAQKLYGDSRRIDAILQANPDQLHSDHDLRPGMMIETP